jgi:hypothetical protein
MLKSKIDLVDALLNIEVTSKLLGERTSAGIHPLDAHYQQLHCALEVCQATLFAYVRTCACEAVCVGMCER